MDSNQNDRQALLQKILDAVKQCQVTFGGKSILATEKDSSVSCLVSQFEQAMQHGIKKNKLIEKISNTLTEPLRQVTQKIIPEMDITYWSAVKEVLGPMDVKHFDNMEGITTDAGKARCWLRSSLNEHSLERHLNAMLADRNLMRQFYEPWALLRDDEISSTLPIMARGLSFMIFAMDVKNEELNAPIKTNMLRQNQKTHRISSNPLPVFPGFDTEPLIVKKINNMKKKKRKRRVVEATITNLEDIPGESRYSRSYSTEDDCQQQRIKDFDNEKKAGRKPQSVPVSPRDFESSDDSHSDSEIDNTTYKTQTSDKIQNDSTLLPALHTNLENKVPMKEATDNSDENSSKNKSANTSCNSHEEVGDELDGDITSIMSYSNSNHKSNVASVIAQNPSPCSIKSDEIEVANDSTKYHQLFMSYDQESSQAASDAIALITSFEPSNSFELSNSFKPVDNFESIFKDGADQLSAIPNIDKYIPKSPEIGYSSSSDLSSVDLKQAILATAKKKDEVEERNKVLQNALDEQRELVNSLRAENEKIELESNEREVREQRKIVALNREIEVLKNQLKKYVAAVQTLRRERPDIPNQEMKGLRLNEEDVAIPERERSTSENDSIFEDKLAQMAELHGELLEFQEKLQRQLAVKDTFISRMKQELIALRGPLPDEVSKDIDSCHTSQESIYTASRPLINIWIPSVFLKGRGTDGHHLYQIYVRVGDEEWNIYRRYSQFNKLHGQMCKIYSTLENFNFPKKKMFGKKDIKFVEERRRKLQEYLRLLINTTLSVNSELSSEPKKSLLLKYIAFFGENYDGNEERKTKNNKDAQKENSPVYTGL